MTTEARDDRCWYAVYPRGMRLAGGFPCPYPTKATVTIPGVKPRRVCGVHARVAERERGKEVVHRD